MFQYRTHLQAPENLTAELQNGTEIKISDLQADGRNRFTGINRFTLEGKEG